LEFGGISGIIRNKDEWSNSMTQDDKDKITGQTRREYREAKQELAALKSMARKLGERMVQIGRILTDQPEDLIFDGESHDPCFRARIDLMNTGELAEAQNLLPLTNQIRETILPVDRLRQEVARLEGEDPEGGGGGS